MTTLRGAWALVIVALLVACLCAGCSTETVTLPGPGGSGSGTMATVTGTIDGDTVRLAFPDGRTETLRILGIDTPEMTLEGNNPEKFGGVADASLLTLWGEEAASSTREALSGEVVAISHDPDAGTRDVYGRLLATVTLADGTDYGESLIKQGLARVYTNEHFAKRDRYLAVEARARDARQGLWSGRAPRQDGASPVAITAVHYNAAGDDTTNLNDEYLTVRNRGTAPADLTSWQVRDSGGFVYSLPQFTLAPGEGVEIHTGSGRNTAGELFMDSPVPVLNNDGDTVTLADRDGTVVSAFSWG